MKLSLWLEFSGRSVLTDGKCPIEETGDTCASSVNFEKKPSFRLLDYEQSLFFLGPSSKTCEIRKWPRAWLRPSFLASRGFAARRSRSLALPSLNLKKRRDCSQSIRLLRRKPGLTLFVFQFCICASIQSLGFLLPFHLYPVCPNLTLTKAHSSSSNISCK